MEPGGGQSRSAREPLGPRSDGGIRGGEALPTKPPSFSSGPAPMVSRSGGCPGVVVAPGPIGGFVALGTFDTPTLPGLVFT